MSKTDSGALKGTGILIMLFHHLFLAGRFDGFEISFWPFSAAQITHIASFCKICVSLFAFISGYGLILSYRRERERERERELRRGCVIGIFGPSGTTGL